MQQSLCVQSNYFVRAKKLKTKNIFVSKAPRLPLEHYFWKALRLRTFVLLVRATCRLRQVWIIDGMILTQKTRSTQTKHVLIPLCPPQIPHGLARDQTRASVVTGRRLRPTKSKLDPKYVKKIQFLRQKEGMFH